LGTELTKSTARPSPSNHELPRIIHQTLDVGKMVRAQRRSQNVRIDDAAALIGVSVDLFSRLENGKGGIRLDKLLSVLDGMGLCMVVCPKNHPMLQDVRHGQLSEAPSASGTEQSEI
jgi:hypothetical protein